VLVLTGLYASIPEVPRRPQHPWQHPYEVAICPEAPGWVTEQKLQAALAHWSGIVQAKIVEDQCMELCLTDRWLPCTENRILIALQDGQYDPNHFDETHSALTWAAMLLPAKLPPVPGRTGDLEGIVLTHGLGHAFGWGHAKTHFGPFAAPPAGHIMHPQAQKAGWSFRGIR
jgi:hypothetical protein